MYKNVLRLKLYNSINMLHLICFVHKKPKFAFHISFLEVTGIHQHSSALQHSIKRRMVVFNPYLNTKKIKNKIYNMLINELERLILTLVIFRFCV